MTIMTYMLGILAIGFALLSVSNSSRPHYALVYLIGVFVSTSMMLILNGVLFVGVSYLIVYVGAILVLFLFVVLLMDISQNKNETINNAIEGKMLITLIIAFILSWYYLDSNNYNPIKEAILNNEAFLNFSIKTFDTNVSYSNQMQSLAEMLYSGVGAPIIVIIGLILMIAMFAVLYHINKKIK